MVPRGGSDAAGGLYRWAEIFEAIRANASVVYGATAGGIQRSPGLEAGRACGSNPSYGLVDDLRRPGTQRPGGTDQRLEPDVEGSRRRIPPGAGVDTGESLQSVSHHQHSSFDRRCAGFAEPARWNHPDQWIW